MNNRLLAAVLMAQTLFAAGLIAAGLRSRETRRLEYLERTHRVTAGRATGSDLEALLALLPRRADEAAVRELFGPPVQRSHQLVVDGARDTPRKGEFWVYYSADAWAGGGPDASKLAGPVRCMVVVFSTGQVERAGLETIIHPLVKD
jgi:hypothetical protein